ncbi:hypothetical protein [Clostridium tarantellae]|uniref:Lipoprotein n=1 Tax=Clostridium tarantellae TaxID=39493 RepID=A0A6I1MTZ9_9CLOT|nr:hypothetical protein [Clostridium tarantellae]MPQ43709.1 hypothetical protein [Clostridium tarantellae]
MSKNTKLIALILTVILAFSIIGCKAKNNTLIPPDRATTDKEFYINKTDDKDEYFKILSEKSKYYLSDIPLDTQYDLSKIDISKIEPGEKFLTDFKNAYIDLEIRLKGFKEELQNNVTSKNNVVIKVNNEIIASIDKNLKQINEFNIKLEEKNSLLNSKNKDNFFKILRKLERNAHKSRVELYKLLENSKVKLGIK